jgi:hypothetical protein
MLLACVPDFAAERLWRHACNLATDRMELEMNGGSR